MEQFILALDQGTTTTTGLLVDRALNIRAKHSSEFKQYYPHPGWVEHDLDEIWKVTQEVIAATLAAAHVTTEQVVGIGITNQRETTGLWEAATGKPLHRAIVWQCRRTTEQCQKLKAQGHEADFKARTGLVLDPYFSGTKLAWLLDNLPKSRAMADKGLLRFGTIDTFLVDRLTGGQVHVTDVSNASRTLMFNILNLSWDEQLVKTLGGHMKTLPTVKSSSEVYGHTKGLSVLPDGIPICGMAGDQQAALFGQACFEPGMVKATYGTGSFILMNTGAKPIASTNGLLTTVGWKIGEQVVYALEGSAFIAGALVQWLRDGLGIIKTSPDVEPLARRVEDTGGVVIVPALAGLGAPHWRPEARGLITGITRGTTAAHLARAALEGIALQNRDLMQAMADDFGKSIPNVRVDGGAAANDLLMQFQADILDVPITRPKVLETTALGAAALAGLAVGYFKGLSEIKRAWQVEREFKPDMPASRREAHLKDWHQAVGKA